MEFRFGKMNLQTTATPPSSAGVLELRSLRAPELRAEKRGSEIYLIGYAATYGTLSQNFGGWRERIMPGAFARAIAEKQDVSHTVNHDKNLVLGRTGAGTTVLREDGKGLGFETKLGTRSYETDLCESVARGDVTGNSFGFICRKETWVEERDADTKQKIDVRELRDLDLVDISTVTYPAYPDTSVGIDSRAMFPEGAPLELRSRVQQSAPKPGLIETAVRPEWFERSLAIISRDSRRNVEFRAAADQQGVLELYIYDDIGESWFSYGITAKGVKAALDSASAPYATIRLCINSMGGDANEATAIYNLLRARASQGKKIEARIDGGAYSAASVIAMAGDTITMGRGAMMMVHCSSCGYWANAAQFRAIADWLDICDDAIADIYIARTGKSVAQVKALMEAETWMGPQDCIDQGFATGLSVNDNAAPVVPEETDCVCACEACAAGRCSDCSNQDCEDTDCMNCPMQAATAKIADASGRSAYLLASYRNVPDAVRCASERIAKLQSARERRMRLRLAEAETS
jgi:HK97 family phage prohead protease